VHYIPVPFLAYRVHTVLNTIDTHDTAPRGVVNPALTPFGKR
jgi:hypothetical protein